MKINEKEIENNGKPYIIAEIGANHNGDMELAKKMIDVAIECGADAVKFQSWNESSIVSEHEYDINQHYDDSPKKHFGSLREMMKKYYLRDEQHFMLKEYCDSKDVDFCSTPTTEREVDLLEELGVPFYKISSMDVNNYRLIRHIASKKRPIIISTGMATMGEIEKAISIIEEMGNKDISILHCISIYPPKFEDINLNNMITLRNMFPSYPIGFSDHSMGTAIPLASVALGACIIEKHFTLDREMEGWDHEISANPAELKEIVEGSHAIATALGSFARIVSEDEKAKIGKFRRSAVITKDLAVGDIIKAEDITYKRPGTYIGPDKEEFLVGRTVNRIIKKEELISWDDLK